jgi:hypothetical protein
VRGDRVVFDTRLTEPRISAEYVFASGGSRCIRQSVVLPGTWPPMVRMTMNNPDFAPKVVPMRGLKTLGFVVRKA